MDNLQIPSGVEVEYTVNRDDPDRIWLNVYHLYVQPAVRGQGLASDAIGELTHAAETTDEIDVITITMQAPPNNQAAIEHLFTEKFAYDTYRGPYKHQKYDNPLVEAEKQVS